MAIQFRRQRGPYILRAAVLHLQHPMTERGADDVVDNGAGKRRYGSGGHEKGASSTADPGSDEVGTDGRVVLGRSAREGGSNGRALTILYSLKHFPHPPIVVVC
jgi:hypothetical protein